MKKLITLLLIGFTFIGCQEEEVGVPNQNQQNPPSVNCDCGEVTWSESFFPFGGLAQTVIDGNCGDQWIGTTTNPISGTVCSGDLTDSEGDPIIW